MTKPARNDPCPCGSGKKYKACCLARDSGASPLAVSPEQRVATLLQQAIGLHQAGQLSQARALYQQILTLDSKQADALHLLGLIEHQQGKSQAGLQHIQQAIEQRPADATFHFNLANLLQDLGQLDAAIASFEQVLKLQPANVDVYVGLGSAMCAGHRREDAIAVYQHALVLAPDSVELHYNLGNALLIQNRIEQSVASYRAALRLQPDNPIAFSNLLFTLQNWPDYPQDDLLREHQAYAERFEAPLKRHWQAHRNARQPDRRLRVGYVSGDFRQHPVAHFIEPILAHHDKTQVEVFGYYNHTQSNDITQRIRAHCDHWLEVKALSDDQLAQRIRNDGIDILVDLSGHTALNRLLVFARKPAPVQVTWFGYIGSTGLSAMDYRLTNAFMDPPGLTERYYSEQLVRLPGSDIAYQPWADSPPVNPLPALSGQPLMLGSLNTLSKINPRVIALWARVLHALPQAQLMLGNVSGTEAQALMKDGFAKEGIAPERLVLQPTLPMTDYLALHQHIDLGLDPFPYNGGTTTLHALWMGVPVVTLAGQHSVARWGVAALSRVGLEPFICDSEDAYVQGVVRAAADLPALNHIRQSLRGRMQSAETSPATITRHLEAAYRQMWRTWCECDSV